MVSIEKIKPFSRKINMNSAGPVSFMEKNLLHETKIRDRFLKIKAVDEVTKKAHQQFGSLTIIIGKIVVRIQSKEWDAKNQKLYATEKAKKKKLFGNDILLNLGINIPQQTPPAHSLSRRSPKETPVGREVNQIKFELDFSAISTTDKREQREFKS